MSGWAYLKHKQVEMVPDYVVPAPVVLIVLSVGQWKCADKKVPI